MSESELDEGYPLVSITIRSEPGRHVATLTIAIACTALSILGMVGRLNYVTPTQFDILASVANNRIWTTAFILIIIGVWTAIITRRRHRLAMQLVFVVTAPWAVYNLLWGLTTEHPVSLAVPLLGCVMAGVAHALVLAWTLPSRSYSQDH